MIASSSKLKSVCESESSFSASSKLLKKHHCLKFHRPIWLLSSWARQFTHTVLHSTQVCKDCKMAPTNIILKGSLWWISILFREERGGADIFPADQDISSCLVGHLKSSSTRKTRKYYQNAIISFNMRYQEIFFGCNKLHLSDKWV